MVGMVVVVVVIVVVVAVGVGVAVVIVVVVVVDASSSGGNGSSSSSSNSNSGGVRDPYFFLPVLAGHPEDVVYLKITKCTASIHPPALLLSDDKSEH